MKGPWLEAGPAESTGQTTDGLFTASAEVCCADYMCWSALRLLLVPRKFLLMPVVSGSALFYLPGEPSCGLSIENANFHDINSSSQNQTHESSGSAVAGLAGMRLILARLSPLLGASTEIAVMGVQPGSIRRSARLAGVKVK